MPQQNSAAAPQGLRHLDELTQERMRELEAAMQPVPRAPSVPEQTLRRTGQRPVRVAGTLLALACGVTPALPFWYEINAYRTDDGYVSDVRLFNKGDSSDLFRVAAHADLDALVAHLEAYDPASDVVVPRVPADGASTVELALYVASLRMRVETMRAHYRGLLGEVLGRLAAA